MTASSVAAARSPVSTSSPIPLSSATAFGHHQRPGSHPVLSGWHLELRSEYHRHYSDGTVHSWDPRAWRQRHCRNDCPDIVGNIQVTHAWGMAQLSAAAHDNNAAYYCNGPGGSQGTPTNGIANSTAGCGANNIPQGHPDDKWGFAVQGALTFNDIPTGAGDTINASGVYTPLQHSGSSISSRGLVELCRWQQRCRRARKVWHRSST
jgi:hypothetical protein